MSFNHSNSHIVTRKQSSLLWKSYIVFNYVIIFYCISEWLGTVATVGISANEEHKIHSFQQLITFYDSMGFFSATEIILFLAYFL